MYVKNEPVWITAKLRQGSSCTYSKTRKLYKVNSGARNAAHLQLTIKTYQPRFEKLYIDLIHSMKNNIKMEHRLNTMCPMHKNESMTYPFQGAFCASHSSNNIKKITVEESNDKIRIKIKDNALGSENSTLKICLNISFSCNKECTKPEKYSSTILTRAYIYDQSKRRKRQLSNKSILIQRVPDRTSKTYANQIVHNKERSSQRKQVKCKHRTAQK